MSGSVDAILLVDACDRRLRGSMMGGLADYPAALDNALRGIQPLQGSATIELNDAAGRVLREPVIADRDLPPYNRAQMDGYALRAKDLESVEAFAVIETIHAGQPPDVSVPPGQCVRIATGAPVPNDVDTVIPHEHSDRKNPVRFRVDSIDTGHAVHPRGADARQGDTLVRSGTVLQAQHLGIAASVGHAQVTVVPRPKVTVLTSGDEIVPPDRSVAGHQVRNSNATMVWELLVRLGAEPIAHRHLRDDAKPTIEAVEAALQQSDLLVTVGGISAGERDFFPAAFEALGVVVSLRGAAIQPGRPIVVGRDPHGTIVVGLPGNPVSALACMCLFCRPIVRVMLGLDASLPWRNVELAAEVKANPKRRAFRPAILSEDGRVSVPTWAGSGDLAHTAATDGLLELPAQTEPVETGTRLRFLPWP